MPITIVTHGLVLMWTEDDFINASCNGENGLFKNYSAMTQFFRDLSYFAFVSLGIFAHNSTLVNHFIAKEKIKL